MRAATVLTLMLIALSPGLMTGCGTRWVYTEQTVTLSVEPSDSLVFVPVVEHVAEDGTTTFHGYSVYCNSDEARLHETYELRQGQTHEDIWGHLVTLVTADPATQTAIVTQSLHLEVRDSLVRRRHQYEKPVPPERMQVASKRRVEPESGVWVASQEQWTPLMYGNEPFGIVVRYPQVAND